MNRLTATLIAGLVIVAGCAAPDGGGDTMAMEDTDEVILGPVDGHDLPGTDLERVLAGQMAPDFTLASLAGPPVTLSSFQGTKNVVLVFFRGHW